MNTQEMKDGLLGLGFTHGYAIGGDPAEIILWENSEPQPIDKDILAAASQGAYQREYKDIQRQRQAAYQAEADPLFFYAERGKAQKQAWLDKIAEIDARYPYPEPPKGKK